MVTGMEMNVGNVVQVGVSWPAALIAAFIDARAGETVSLAVWPLTSL
jgi:hypothetical protein